MDFRTHYRLKINFTHTLKKPIRTYNVYKTLQLAMWERITTNVNKSAVGWYCSAWPIRNGVLNYCEVFNLLLNENIIVNNFNHVFKKVFILCGVSKSANDSRCFRILLLLQCELIKYFIVSPDNCGCYSDVSSSVHQAFGSQTQSSQRCLVIKYLMSG